MTHQGTLAARLSGRLTRAGLACLVALQLAGPAEAACRVTPRATIPLQEAGGLFLVPVTINGIETRFILDTGAERSVVGIEAADRLHLARDEWVSTDIRGVGGRDRRRLGRPDSLTLGGVALRRHTVAADNSVVVGPITGTVAGIAVAGLLGEDLLSPFDLDIDPQSHTLTLNDTAGCSGAFIPWAAQAQAIAADRPIRNILTVPVTANGHSLVAELDTGAEATVLLQPGMTKLGIQPGGGDAIRGFGNNTVAARSVPLTLRVGQTTLAQWPVIAAPIYGLRIVDILLGADWLRRQRVWVSWSTNQVFVGPLTPP